MPDCYIRHACECVWVCLCCVRMFSRCVWPLSHIFHWTLMQNFSLKRWTYQDSENWLYFTFVCYIDCQLINQFFNQLKMFFEHVASCDDFCPDYLTRKSENHLLLQITNDDFYMNYVVKIWSYDDFCLSCVSPRARYNLKFSLIQSLFSSHKYKSIFLIIDSVNLWFLVSETPHKSFLLKRNYSTFIFQH